MQVISLIDELATEIEERVEADYPKHLRAVYPDMQRKFERDMEIVWRAREFLMSGCF
ncbi:MAG: hypothetical protein LPL29_13310 [Alphaproteobacteria bacterium]|nr:hypothetical protein [Alphaproteobacteria bacterium]